MPYLISAAIHSYIEKKWGVKYIEKIGDGDAVVLKWLNSVYKREKRSFSVASFPCKVKHAYLTCWEV